MTAAQIMGDREAELYRKLRTAQGTILVLMPNREHAIWFMAMLYDHPDFLVRKSAAIIERCEGAPQPVARFLFRSVGQMPYAVRGMRLNGLIIYGDVDLTQDLEDAIFPCFIEQGSYMVEAPEIKCKRCGDTGYKAVQTPEGMDSEGCQCKLGKELEIAEIVGHTINDEDLERIFAIALEPEQ